MADTIIYCKICDKDTEHMHLAGRVCICSICGESNQANNWKEIQEKIDKRKAEAAASLARTNFGTDLDFPIVITQEQKDKISTRYLAGEAACDLAKEHSVSGKTIRGYVAEARGKANIIGETKAVPVETPATETETQEPKGETNMKLTDENKADIIRRSGAGEATSILAADFHVSDQSIRNVLNAAGKGKKAKKAKSPRATRPAAQPQGDQAGGFKASLQALVDAAVDAKLADLGYVKADELDAKVADALARALK